LFAVVDYDLFTIAAICGKVRPALDSSALRIKSITNSSLEVKPGSVFVPLVDKRDGHDFISDALRRGAAAFFCQEGHAVLKKLSREEKSRCIIVKDTLLALGALAHFHRRRFSPWVIAVTGSNGKTTTKEMLAQIFRHAHKNQVLATEKNYNNHIGVPFTLFGIKKTTRVAIIEMGMNHAGEIAYLSQMAEPHAAIISSIGHAHIEFFKSRAGIATAKAEITAGMLEGASLYIPKKIAEQKILERAAKLKQLRLKQIDPHRAGAWHSNFALAAAVARDAGIAQESITYVERNFKAPDGRMQIKRGYFTLIDDGYNANPDSALSSIDAAGEIAKGAPVICVFGDFKELGKFERKLHVWTGREATKRGVSAFYGVGDAMKAAVAAFRGRKYHFSRDAVAEIVKQLKQEHRGSVLLIKGSRSMKMEEIVAALEKSLR